MAIAGKITVVSATDTGVGKTVLTGLLVHFLRSTGISAVALKPFSSGSRADARFLCAMQDRALTLDQINPFHFPEPLAPLVAARKHRRKISLDRVLAFIRTHAKQRDHVIVEGAGGLLTPLGEGFSILNVVQALDADLIIVAPNKLGVINHTLLTVQAASAAKTRVVLMRQKKEDISARSNAAILEELLAPVPVCDFPYLRFRKKKTPP